MAVFAASNPPGGTASSLTVQLKAAQLQATRLKAQIAVLQKRRDKAKAGKGKTMSSMELERAQAQLVDLNKNIDKIQNKVYEESGQYDKLLTGSNRDAYMALNTLFEQYDLGSLSGKIYDYVKNGYSADTISILLQDTPEYKTRFAANEARKKAGMNVLTPAEYLSIESSYRQIMRQSGLPTGFYDQPTDFTKFISGDMSPTELQGRVDLATQASVLASDTVKQALQQMGLNQGDIAAYFLDPNKALPHLTKAAATAQIGAEALARGLEFNTQRAEQLATSGVGRDEAAQGFAQIADEFSDLKTLGSIYGQSWSQSLAEADVFNKGGAATQQRNTLIGNEKANFSGSAGGARGGLAQRGGSR